MNQAVTGQGSNSATVRQCNERMILGALRRLGQASKAELARQVNLTPNTAGQIVRDLEQQNLVCIAGKRSGLRGQPATLLQLDPEGAYSIGIEIERGTLVCLLVDFNGSVLKSRRHRWTLPLPAETLRIVREDIAILRRSLPPAGQTRIAGIGLAVPDTFAKWQRTLALPDAICTAWDTFDFAGRLSEALRLPVLAENHATAVAAAELCHGHGREFDDFAVVYIGGVIARGLVLDRGFRRGIAAGSPDIIPADLIRQLGNDRVPPASDTIPESEPLAGSVAIRDWMELCIDSLIGPLLSMAGLLDLRAIVIAGTLPRPGLDDLVGRLRLRLLANWPGCPDLRAGSISHNAASIGAAVLPLLCHYRPRHDLLSKHEARRSVRLGGS